MDFLMVFVFLYVIFREAGCGILLGTHSTRKPQLARFDGACAGKSATVIMQENGVRTTGDRLFMNSTIYVKEDIKNEPLLHMQLERCKSKENLDSCEVFYKYKSEHYCREFSEKNPLWGSVFRAYTPPWTCPLTKGVHRGINSSLDMSAFLLFPVDNWYWKMKLTLYENNNGRQLLCLIVEALLSTISD